MFRKSPAPTLVLGATLVLASWGRLVETAAADAWETHVRPLLESKCLKCHGGAKQKGGLDLRSVAAVLQGGESGPAVTPGKPESSLLYAVVQPEADPHMPPKGDPVTPGERLLLRAWIETLDSGAGHGLAQAAAVIPEWSPPEGTSVAQAINLRLAARWEQDGIVPAEPCDDAAFARRAYVDLAGRIPTATELEGLLAEADPARRAALVDRLLAGVEYPRHMAEIFDTVLLRRPGDGQSDRGDRQTNGWLDYLHWAFSVNRRWDRMAKDMLLARPESEQEAGGSWFLAEKKDDPDVMATETARALLGKQIQCAQCHDHPVSPEIEHRHYWGMVAFFKRTYRVRTPGGMRVGEAATGGYAEYKDLGGTSHEAELAFLDGTTFAEERNEGPDTPELYKVAPPDSYFEAPADGNKQEENNDRKRRQVPEMGQAPVPTYSRRALLAGAVIDANPGFAAAAVNRFWAYLTGRGLVHPVDQMDSAHPASHPQLLRWLARDFAEHGYDVQRLIRGIMTSDAYQLDSRHPAGNAPLPETFARMLPKPLPAETLARSLLVACGRSPRDDGSFEGVDEDHYRQPLVERFPALFPEVVSPEVGQALFFTNNPLVDALISPQDASALAARMLAAADSRESTRLAFWHVLGRLPDDAEYEKSIAYLDARADRPQAAAGQLLWALLASAEFRFTR